MAAKEKSATEKSEKTEDSQTRVVQGKDGSINITHPKGKRPPHVTVLLESDELVREQVGGFVQFLRERAVVGLAVGFIIGLQAQALVRQMVDSFLTPLLTVWFQDLSERQFTLHTGSTPVALTWGKFVYALITFLFVLLFVYLVVKIFRLDKIDKPKVTK
jgi:large-conductance mechanosensitive channel